MSNNDRIKSGNKSNKLPKPEVSVIKDGNSIYKPGMKTYFVDTDEDDPSVKNKTVYGSNKTVVGGTVCVCDMVCTCEAVNSSKSSGGSSYKCICTCVPVH